MLNVTREVFRLLNVLRAGEDCDSILEPFTNYYDQVILKNDALVGGYVEYLQFCI